MGLFSWFKKKKEVEKGVTEEEILDRAEREMSRPTFKIKGILSNTTLTIFLPSGAVVTNNDADRDMYKRVMACTSEAQVSAIMLPEDTDLNRAQEISRKKIVDKANNETLVKGVKEMVEEGEDFYWREDSLYMHGINLSIPESLATEFLAAAKEEEETRYVSLKRFWYWAALNQNAQAREDMFSFLEGGDFKITVNGNFLARRRVVSVDKGVKSSDARTSEYVTAAYLKVKGWKKKPSNFVVILEGVDLKTVSLDKVGNSKVVGNLAELQAALSNMDERLEYTDMRTHKMKIVIGEEVSMPREQCDEDPNSSCSRGLHVASRGFDTSGNGDTVILVAVNPMNVVAVPYNESSKMRVCAYMPLAVVQDDSEAIDFIRDVDSINLEEGYFADQVDKLEEMLKGVTFSELASKKLIAKDVTEETFDNILEAFEGAKEQIKGRVVKV